MALAVTNQPGVPMAPMPGGPLIGVPPGLEVLASLDQLIIKQKIEIMELLTGCERRNKYNVFNNQQQQTFYCHEESETCNRMCCGPNRGFTFHILDNFEREVMSLERPFMCCVGCPWCADGCCAYPINIYDSQRQKIGMMRMTNFCCAPRFGVFDSADNKLYEITGEVCRCQGPCCRADVEFPVCSMSGGAKVANVSKQWAGVFREMITDADTYSVTFPMDMHVIHKALIFASVFLVDMTLYENKDGSGSN